MLILTTVLIVVGATQIVRVDNVEAIDFTNIANDTTFAAPFIDTPRAKVVICGCRKTQDVFYNRVMLHKITALSPHTIVQMLTPDLCKATVDQSVGFDNTTLFVAIICSELPRRLANDSLLRHQPIYMSIAGEVFWRNRFTCKPFETAAVYRGSGFGIRNCNETLHALQFSAFLFDNYLPKVRPNVFETLAPQNASFIAKVIASKSKFAAYSFGKFSIGAYLTDFVVRHAFVALLKRRVIDRPNVTVDAIGRFSNYGRAKSCPGWIDRMPDCFAPYKFAIVMENSRLPGYISEKLLNAYLGHSVPVYFGAPDVLRYFNADSMVRCDVSNETITMLRQIGKDMPDFHKSVSANPLEFIDRVATLVDVELAPCIERILELDASPELYASMLRQSPFATGTWRNSFVDGYQTSCDFLHIVARQRPDFARLLDNEWRDRCARFN